MNDGRICLRRGRVESPSRRTGTWLSGTAIDWKIKPDGACKGEEMKRNRTSVTRPALKD